MLPTYWRRGGLEQPACDEERIRADERRLHLPEQMQVVAAHRQYVVSPFHVNLRRFVVMPRLMTDGAEIHHDRPMDLRELLGIELLEQVLQRRPHHRLGRFPSIAPGNDRVLRVGAKVVDIVDRDEAYDLPRLR